MTRAILDKLCFTSSQQPASVGNEDAESLLAECSETDAILLQTSLVRSIFNLNQGHFEAARCNSQVSFLRRYLLLHKRRLMCHLLALLNSDKILISFCASRAFVQVFLHVENPMEEWLHHLLSQLCAAPHVAVYSLQCVGELLKAFRKREAVSNDQTRRVCFKALCKWWTTLLKTFQANGKCNQSKHHASCSGAPLEFNQSKHHASCSGAPLEFLALAHEILRHREGAGGTGAAMVGSSLRHREGAGGTGAAMVGSSLRHREGAGGTGAAMVGSSLTTAHPPVDANTSISTTTTEPHTPPESEAPHCHKLSELNRSYANVSGQLGFTHTELSGDYAIGEEPAVRGHHGRDLLNSGPLSTTDPAGEPSGLLPGDDHQGLSCTPQQRMESLEALQAMVADSVEEMVDLFLAHESPLLLAKLYDILHKLLQMEGVEAHTRMGPCVGRLFQSTVAKEVIREAWHMQSARKGWSVIPARETSNNTCVLNIALRKMVVFALRYTQTLLQLNDVQQVVDLWHPLQETLSGSHEETLSGSHEETLSGSHEETLSGSHEETLSGSHEETMSGSHEETMSGSHEETMSGSHEETLSGSHEETLSGSHEEGISCAQDILFGVLSEQDDCLVKSLLACTHIRSLSRSLERDTAGHNTLRMLNVHSLVVLFLASVSYDHSALLDFLMSEETPFLDFLVEYLQLVSNDWENLCEACTLETTEDNIISSLSDSSDIQEKLLDQDVADSSTAEQCEDEDSSERSDLEACCRGDDTWAKQIKLSVNSSWSPGHSFPQEGPWGSKTLDSVVGVFIRLKYALLRLDSKGLIPLALCRLIPLLECVEGIYEAI